MKIYKKVYSPHGILVGQSAWTKDKKPGLRVKKHGHKCYDTMSLEDLENQVLRDLGII